MLFENTYKEQGKAADCWDFNCEFLQMHPESVQSEQLSAEWVWRNQSPPFVKKEAVAVARVWMWQKQEATLSM